MGKTTTIILGFILFFIGFLTPIVIFFLFLLGARSSGSIAGPYRTAFCSNLATGV